MSQVYTLLITSMPNITTLFLLPSARISSTSGITIENFVFEKTFAFEMSMSLTVFPSPGRIIITFATGVQLIPLGYCSVAITGISSMLAASTFH